ncbi:MAG: excinuclease ABC subunit UvrC [Bacteroidales bacterium]|nr:excinuclease ABC subunit UvrC [Bacteroidales bacterium]
MRPVTEHISLILKTLPNKPGCYQYFNEAGEIIYVGKARNLKNRISSYFAKEHHESAKVELLVRKIFDIQLIVVDSEAEALLLENTLIKKYKPRYNILLKDDKTYPWLAISHEPFPRVFSTRKRYKNGDQYFGPYSNVRMMNTLLDLVQQLYPIRTCKMSLIPEKIKRHSYKSCLEYHLGNCMAPCEGEQTQAEYLEMIHGVREILKGNIKGILKQLHDAMMEEAGRLAFEKAQLYKDKIQLLQQYQSRSTVVSSLITNIDVFSIHVFGDEAFVNFMQVVDGAVVQSHTIEIKKRLDETTEELLGMAITEMRQQSLSQAHELVVSMIPDITFPDIDYTVPQRGDKLKLLELSEKNAKMYRLDKEKKMSLVDPEMHTNRLLTTMKNDLRMKELPRHIECFDNSNTQGTYPVAALVVFKDAKPSKKDYRHFLIKTVEGPDDFASMEEVLYRRYQRLLNENQPLPQLIVVDGGKGQLSSAVDTLEKLNLRGKISVIGIAKRLEEIYFPEDSIPIYIEKTSPTLRIIQQLRDEAHRFGITHHRKRREKGSLAIQLTDIKGIGKETAEKLLKKFKSIQQVKETDTELLVKVIGKAKTALLQQELK